ncbi:tRNA epoxyqueuosine(34) reductase QueG [Colwellia sp. E2M01]|uniref:tRNA epoxyqueuosine(34) reductase QueG n=1 Tax=Colwellia sp. E2M01 TaxID=2841561 RepID=UPI001C0954F2|nr:tRNA epoxyqueuosine(34) reductase QueG [Colwellia sp. E2M01]MBU2871206.1 tRNA epoxyqueuosine(34) reductase QueG [Colwellia sp. E2M01]
MTKPSNNEKSSSDKAVDVTEIFDYQALAEKIKAWGKELGFSDLGISDIDLSHHESTLERWLDQGFHGNMDYMARHGLMRARPAELVPGTVRVISVRLDYLPHNAQFSSILKDKHKAYISRYALGRDYHKLMRKRLQQLGKKIAEHCPDFNCRPFVDSAPVMERPLAEKAGLGWAGKHTLLINKEAGSWFFLGELFVDIPLPVTVNEYSENAQKSLSEPTKAEKTNDCGTCVACIKICPTKAIVEPYTVDAKRCISYFTIESPDPIPKELRPLMGNRIYGCDDCQLICPWNKYAKLSLVDDFQARNNLDDISLLELFSWSEEYFLQTLEGSPIRRIGFQSWMRNIAVALGNAPYNEEIIAALTDKLATSSELVQEHIYWALEQQAMKMTLTDKAASEQNKNHRLTLRLTRSIEKGLPRDA